MIIRDEEEEFTAHAEMRDSDLIYAHQIKEVNLDEQRSFKDESQYEPVENREVSHRRNGSSMTGATMFQDSYDPLRSQR